MAAEQQVFLVLEDTDDPDLVFSVGLFYDPEEDQVPRLQFSWSSAEEFSEEFIVDDAVSISFPDMAEVDLLIDALKKVKEELLVFEMLSGSSTKGS